MALQEILEMADHGAKILVGGPMPHKKKIFEIEKRCFVVCNLFGCTVVDYGDALLRNVQ